MPSDNFWKKTIVFSLAFLLGTLSSDFSYIYTKTETVEVPAKELIINKVLNDFSHNNEKNCFSKDETLKYRNLPLGKSDESIGSQNLPYSDEELSEDIDRLFRLNMQLIDLEEELKKLENSNTKKVNELKRQKKVIEAEIDKILKIPGKSEFYDELHSETQNLIHLEKCSDI